MRALGKASYINGSQFAILWVNSRGETEQYASEVLQSKLGTWFNQEVMAQARQLVANATELQGTPDYAMSQITENDADDIISERIGSPDDDGLDQDDAMGGSMITWDQSNMHERGGMQTSNGSPKYQIMSYPESLRQRMHAPELRRTSSMPTSMQGRASQHSGDVASIKGHHARPQALDMKAVQEDQAKFQLPQGPPNSSNPEYRALIIGHTDEVAAFLETRFRQLQQLVCKIVAKAWIKVIEPKKQTRYPYNKGEDSKPLWWPASVRHKEPDHLMKPERITLLMTMLRCGKVPTNRLELATAEVAAFIPPDKINLLREIYRVGREEERFKNQEIPADSRIYVASTAVIVSNGDDNPSPSTAGLRDDLTPRSAGIGNAAHTALQRTTSNSMPPTHYEEHDPFIESGDMPQGYAMMPPQPFYYNNHEPSYSQHPNAAVMASQQSLQAQQFQHAQQQQMFAAQQIQARRNPALPQTHIPFSQATWPHNVEHSSWPQSPPSAAVFPPRHGSDGQMHQGHQQHEPHPQAIFSGIMELGEPKRIPQTPKRPVPEETSRSSPYLPTPMRGVPDPNFSAQRAQGVSFSDYLHSPRTGGPEPQQDGQQYQGDGAMDEHF